MTLENIVLNSNSARSAETEFASEYMISAYALDDNFLPIQRFSFFRGFCSPINKFRSFNLPERP